MPTVLSYPHLLQLLLHLTYCTDLSTSTTIAMMANYTTTSYLTRPTIIDYDLLLPTITYYYDFLLGRIQHCVIMRAQEIKSRRR